MSIYIENKHLCDPSVRFQEIDRLTYYLFIWQTFEKRDHKN